MELAFNLPSMQFGYWLPVYKGDGYAARAIKRIVLRSFQDKVTKLKYSSSNRKNFVTVKNFQWIQHEYNILECQTCEPYENTYGWKADFTVLEIV